MPGAFLSQRKKPSRRWVLAVLALLLLVAGVFGVHALTDPYDCKIVENVSIGGLDVGGMTISQARRAVKQASDAVLEGTVLTAALPEETLHLSPADTKASLRTWHVLLAAYKAGRTEEQAYTIGLRPYLKLDERYIRDVLANYAARYDTDLTPSHYTVSGEMPDLELEHQPENRTCPTLELTMGLPTAKLDQQEAFDRIMAVYDTAFRAAAQNAYTAEHFKVDILEEPERPALQQIYDELYVAPVDDSLDLETFSPVPGAYGCHFDLAKARLQAAQAEYGETVSIPMELLSPEITGEKVYFRDVLGYCETPHTADENRNNNLRLACEAMNGTILQPGDVFSYNETLGPRTKERGYLQAGAYSGWELVMSYGGGICQGSSTLYCATLYADLEIVSRVNHGHKVGYMGAGLDATVSWNGPDYQFRNNTNFPVKIAAEVSDGYLKVTLLGTEERDYYVEMDVEQGWGSNVLYTKTYKCKYDKETDELISRELECRSNYAL